MALPATRDPIRTWQLDGPQNQNQVPAHNQKSDDQQGENSATSFLSRSGTNVREKNAEADGQSRVLAKQEGFPSLPDRFRVARIARLRLPDPFRVARIARLRLRNPFRVARIAFLRLPDGFRVARIGFRRLWRGFPVARISFPRLRPAFQQSDNEIHLIRGFLSPILPAILFLSGQGPKACLPSRIGPVGHLRG
mgnify:CR=1 FL=1